MLVIWQAQRSTPAPRMDEVQRPAERPAVAQRRARPGSSTPPEVAAVEPEVCVEPTPPALPALAESDPTVAAAVAGCVGGLAPHWIAAQDLLRRVAVVLVEAEAGRVPRGHLAFMAVAGPFRIVDHDGVPHLSSASYRRYERFVDVVTCMPPGRAAEFVDRFQALVTEALASLGETGPDARTRVEALLDKVLSVPMPPGFVPLVQPNVLFEYVDPSLEALDDFQKQLLRMGPANLARLQDYARAVRAELGRPPPGPICPEP